jgi:hypothetical protein
MKIIKYGPGGRDTSKPNDNIREEREIPDLPHAPGLRNPEPPPEDESD